MNFSFTLSQTDLSRHKSNILFSFYTTLVRVFTLFKVNIMITFSVVEAATEDNWLGVLRLPIQFSSPLPPCYFDLFLVVLTLLLTNPLSDVLNSLEDNS